MLTGKVPTTFNWEVNDHLSNISALTRGWEICHFYLSLPVDFGVSDAVVSAVGIDAMVLDEVSELTLVAPVPVVSAVGIDAMVLDIVSELMLVAPVPVVSAVGIDAMVLDIVSELMLVAPVPVVSAVGIDAMVLDIVSELTLEGPVAVVPSVVTLVDVTLSDAVVTHITAV